MCDKKQPITDYMFGENEIVEQNKITQSTTGKQHTNKKSSGHRFQPYCQPFFRPCLGRYQHATPKPTAKPVVPQAWTPCFSLALTPKSIPVWVRPTICHSKPGATVLPQETQITNQGPRQTELNPQEKSLFCEYSIA